MAIRAVSASEPPRTYSSSWRSARRPCLASRTRATSARFLKTFPTRGHLLRVDRDPPGPLGDIMVKNGVITPEQLSQAIEAQRTHRDNGSADARRPRGDPRGTARGARRLRSSRRCTRFTWSEGTFNFEPDAKPDAQDIVVSMNPESLCSKEDAPRRRVGTDAKKVPSSTSSSRSTHRKRARAASRSRTTRADVLELIDGQRDVGASSRRPAWASSRSARRCSARHCGSRTASAPRRARSARSGARGRRAPQPRRRVLQDGYARRSRARRSGASSSCATTTRRRTHTSG